MGINMGLKTIGVPDSTGNIFAGIHPPMEVENIKIGMGQNLKRGACLGKRIWELESITVTPNSGNTGNGTLTLADPPVDINRIKRGTYVVNFTTDTQFEVRNANLVLIGTGTVGVIFDGEIRFVITVGTINFAPGDNFEIALTFQQNNDPKYYLWAPLADNGTENLLGILGCDVDATASDTPGFMYVHGEFIKSALTAAGEIKPGVYNYGTIVIKEDNV